MICMLTVIHYFRLMFLKTLEKYIKIYHFDQAKFLSVSGLAWKAALKKAEIKLELLTDIDMLLMVEKGTRGGLYLCNQWICKS